MESLKRYKVVIAERAAQLLDYHAAFLANVSESAARQFVKAFKEAAQSLELFPERGPWLYDDYMPKSKYRTLVFAKRFVLVYQIKDSTVFVDAVVDCRQDYQWLL
ncbi:MAG: type II toxin-antitoxin system RelE/ParE family toxin [Peptococcaceae bacterium]|nr:type II toxin-antitoxin system RelE/ParE family toxin [Peptococcaceae bacterium]